MKSKFGLLICLAALLALTGCTKKFGMGQANIQKGIIEGTLEHDGQQRSFIFYVPEAYTGKKPVPLLFNFHGYTISARDQMGYGDFRPVADTAGFIIIHPQGTLLEGKTHWNVGGWTLASTVDDVDFSEALIEMAAKRYNIDRSRVYSTGMSNGGYMSFLLACKLSNKIAAIASVTGSMTPQILAGCNPKHPTPVLQIHGTRDEVVPYDGANWTQPIEKVIEYWIGYNNNSITPVTHQLADSDSSDGSTVEQIAYYGGDEETRVIHYKVMGGGHTWPGTAIKGPGTNNDFNASKIIWEFLSQYDINGLR